MKSLRQKIEGAFKVYLEQTIDSGVYTGLGSFEVSFPAVVASYLGGEDIHPESNHVSAEVMLTAISSADSETVENAADKHNELFGKIVEACESPDLAGDIMAAGDGLIVNGIQSTTEEQPDVETDEAGQAIFKSSYSVRLMAGHN
jgi:hypothetical protein